MRSLLFGFVLGALAISCNQKPAELKFQYNAQTMQKQLIEAYPSGDTQVVHFYITVNGQKQLHAFQSYFKDGNVKVQGLLTKDGKRIGTWESFYPDGKPWSVGTYDTAGVENGLKRVWYDNGKVRYQGQMVNGKSAGEWEFFDRKGNKTN